MLIIGWRRTPQKCVEVLKAYCLWFWPFVEIGSLADGHTGLRWATILSDVLIGRLKMELMTQRKRRELSSPKERNVRDCWQPQKIRQAWSTFRRTVGEPTLATPGFQTSSLQMTQRINLCGLKHPGCGTLLQQPWNLKRNSLPTQRSTVQVWSVCSRRSDLCLLRKGWLRIVGRIRWGDLLMVSLCPRSSSRESSLLRKTVLCSLLPGAFLCAGGTAYWYPPWAYEWHPGMIAILR